MNFLLAVIFSRLINSLTLCLHIGNFLFFLVPLLLYASIVAGHAGKLVFGLLGDNDVPTVCMVGRFHFYEGFALTQTTYPIRLMSLLGVETLIGKPATNSDNAFVFLVTFPPTCFRLFVCLFVWLPFLFLLPLPCLPAIAIAMFTCPAIFFIFHGGPSFSLYFLFFISFEHPKIHG